jgi:multidrug resistance efflux pump
MIRKFILPILAVLGVVFAAWTVRNSSGAQTPAPPVAAPAEAPYASQVAGAGLVEASTENIAVGAVVPGVVTQVNKQAGDAVKKGDVLFVVDDRELQAQLKVAEANLLVKQRNLELLKAQPRETNLGPLQAQVAGTEATLANRQRELRRLQGIGQSASRDELESAQWQEKLAIAEVDAAKARVAQEQVNVSAWTQAVAAAEAEVEAARASIEQVKTEIDRHTVRSPIDGSVMQVKVRVGEYAPTGPMQTPLMLVGDIDTLQIRVDVDENDAWRVKPGATATAFIRGNSALKTQLKFHRIEPFVVPKRSLTGESSERVDTRVLQVLYRFSASEFAKANGSPVYVGQQMDVSIDAGEQSK